MSDDLSVGGVRDRATIVALDAYWKDWRYYYDASGNLEYMCMHYIHNAPTSDSFWEIVKFTPGSNGITRREGPLQGSVDNRATLNWG